MGAIDGGIAGASPAGVRFAAASLLTVSLILAAAAAAWLLVEVGFPSPETLSLLFVIPVLASAVLYGIVPALAAAAVSVIVYNFVLLPPLWDVGLIEPENVAKMAVLGFVAIVAGALSARTRKLARESQQRERILSGVYALSQDMLGIVNLKEMRTAAEAKLSALLGSEAHVLLVGDGTAFDETAALALKTGQPAGGGASPGGGVIYLPLINRTAAIGVIRTAADITARFSLKELGTLAAQVASALEKARLAEAHEQELRDAERESFLSALLSSVSHDLKTPLVTVIGGLSALKDTPAISGDAGSRDVVDGALDEARKLNRFLTNLVEIGRLESGLEAVKREAVSLRDLLASALKSLQPLIGRQRFSIDEAPDFPLLYVNPSLMEIVFLNLLDNAIKYGPPESDVKIVARWDGSAATIDVDDDGEGIPPSEREAIFVKFYRAKHGDRKVAGTGLGLYICRAIVAVHGGDIAAIDPHDGKGACVRVTLPPEAVRPVRIEAEPDEVT